MPSSRFSVLSRAFQDHPIIVNGKALRPLTAGTLMLLMETGNPLFSEPAAGASEPTEAETFQSLFEFIWIHYGPEDDVIRQCEDPALLRAAARKFSLGFGFDELQTFSAQFEAIRTRINSAMVDIIPEAGAKKHQPEKPGPIGSPPLSTASEVPEIQTVNSTSSGVSLSIAPSNTSTQPTPTTEPHAVGKSRIWEAPESPEEPEENVIPIC